MQNLKIATFNVNGIGGRLPNLLQWLEKERPDIVCLQELKAQDKAFPAGDIEAAGYGSIHHGQASWNGVAILARDSEPLLLLNPVLAPHLKNAGVDAWVRGEDHPTDHAPTWIEIASRKS
ncbi:hypothetical protein BFW87_18860 [Pseudomonas fluorescens]|uniref:Endonuclease/exonuclease/phosphatase domain-containing protein n=1 Tax=Pseudomonas fluorescens TaxID=294 RepID=A0A1T2YIG6_PSEFL|nr:endonuclease/exonuclease/phosphatase family protein [Pseudomonas fluorescens]OPA91689.1 hypothetical protein BFW87_18860 [Pseudomonas fluorescens]